DQPGDGEHGVLEMFTASDVALQEPLSGSAMACSTQIHCEGWAFAQCGIGQLRLWCLLRWFLRRGCMDRPGGVMRLGGGRRVVLWWPGGPAVDRRLLRRCGESMRVSRWRGWRRRGVPEGQGLGWW